MPITQGLVAAKQWLSMFKRPSRRTIRRDEIVVATNDRTGASDSIEVHGSAAIAAPDGGEVSIDRPVRKRPSRRSMRPDAERNDVVGDAPESIDAHASAVIDAPEGDFLLPLMSRRQFLFVLQTGQTQGGAHQGGRGLGGGRIGRTNFDFLDAG